MEISEYIKILTAILAIVNPISTVPYFLSFTQDSKEERPKIALETTLAVFIIMVVSVFLGTSILGFFNITVDGFRIAGGLLLLYLSFNMLFAKKRVRHTEEENQEAQEKESVAVIPLAIPLLAGPGTISTIILLSSRLENLVEKFILVSACLIVTLCVWTALAMAPQISRAISQTGMNVFTRIMGLLLAAVAVEFVINGLKAAFPGLAG